MNNCRRCRTSNGVSFAGKSKPCPDCGRAMPDLRDIDPKAIRLAGFREAEQKSDRTMELK